MYHQVYISIHPNFGGKRIFLLWITEMLTVVYFWVGGIVDDVYFPWFYLFMFYNFTHKKLFFSDNRK